MFYQASPRLNVHVYVQLHVVKKSMHLSVKGIIEQEHLNHRDIAFIRHL